jgi:acyl dehydratase
MLLVGFLSELMVKAFGRQWLESGQLRVRFKGPAYPGDRLTISGVVKEIRNEGAFERVVCSVSCLNQDQSEVLVGEASVALKGTEGGKDTIG